MFACLSASYVFADGPSFSEDFESYGDGSNLRGQGGWDGLTNQGSVSEMPVSESVLLGTGRVLNTRAIQQADRIHQVGHALPVFDKDVVTTLSAQAYAAADSINSGIGVGNNPSPGAEIATNEGFFSASRAGWYSTAEGWAFDLRGVAGIEETNFFSYPLGLGKTVTLRIVVDGPARLIYGQLYDGTATTTTPSRSISAGLIGELSAVAIYSDWRLPDLAELQTLTNYAVTDPAALAAFDSDCSPGCAVTACSCTPSAPLWSSTTLEGSPEQAWSGSFTEGSSVPADKTQNSYAVRAVRGGH